MSKMQSAAALAPLIDVIGKHGGRCDRRRLTNAVALVQDAAVVLVSLESGGDRDPATSCEPGFPEQLSAELVAMRSDGLLTAAPGGRFRDGIATTDRCRRIRSRYPRTPERIGPAVRSVARMIAGRLALAPPLLAADGGMDSEPDRVDPLTTGTLNLRATPTAERDIREQGPKLQAALAAGRTQAVALSERQIL